MIAPAFVRPRVPARPVPRLHDVDAGAAVRVATRLPPFLLAAVVLHTAVLPQVRPLDVGADGMLLLAVAAGLVGGPSTGAWMGFATGLLADCFLATPFGLSALAYGIAGWAVGIVVGRLLRPGWWMVPATALVASAAGVGLFAALGALLGEGGLAPGRLVAVAVGVGVLNALLSPAAVAAVRWAVGPGRRPLPLLEGGR